MRFAVIISVQSAPFSVSRLHPLSHSYNYMTQIGTCYELPPWLFSFHLKTGVQDACWSMYIFETYWLEGPVYIMYVSNRVFVHSAVSSWTNNYHNTHLLIFFHIRCSNSLLHWNILTVNPRRHVLYATLMEAQNPVFDVCTSRGGFCRLHNRSRCC